ncbi:exodeoxyribonuclease III [Sinorhizobium fredii]|uniref:Exodeoxyribonuclease III n=2 Tax=Rhizobium fredii TaxID=380 RepID=A0A2A6M0Q4_RHIFR|nr:exodeoxyribonuclease III [Sinorhizobium fredii]ASY70726.1 Exodeoxyribonuclease III [Sinorhizobium fredii CCBAU 83666]PDT48147.1 exodeoxyribonuclease III [Sinorhizobium fredii]CCE97670.1 exodeoxyribonuclease III [Sinorhizobium fredii HH103]
MALSIATWNINSVRLRMPLVEHLLVNWQPDILCLQETKCPDDQFPSVPLRKLGYNYIEMHGQKGYHGVATISRLPLTELTDRRNYCGVGDARHLSVVFAAGGKTVRLHNFYVPAGGDEPDRTINPKFGHKLDFVDEMKLLHAEAEAGISSILVGDLNIAPLEHDVWSHKQLLKIVSHTPVETDGLTTVMTGGAWVDLMRQHTPPPEKLYTWWSYRAKDWAAVDRGRRLDHIWSSADLAAKLVRVDILREARGWERPSDHVPVIAHFEL